MRFLVEKRRIRCQTTLLQIIDGSHAYCLTDNQLEALGEQIAEHATHLDAATHRLLFDIRTFDQAEGWGRVGARSCADWLAWRCGWSGGTAREHVRVANALDNLPQIDDALRRGEVSYCKVRAMTRVATPENEALLIEDALHSTGIQLESIVRRYAAVKRGVAPTPEDDAERRRISKRDLDDGMVGIHVTLHPEEAELLWAALTRIASERSEEFSRVDALVEMVQQVTRGTSPDRTPTDLVVTVPVDALDGDPDVVVAATTQDGACLSTHTARRLACDCGLIPMLEDAAGNCMSVGRKTRTIPASMKRALLRRDKTCRFPGCCNKVFIDGHHAKHWAEGGETSLDNLVSLCGFHHRFVHEYGYRVELDEHQQPRFFDRQDRVLPEVAPRSTGVGDGRAAIAQRNASLSITASTAAPRWDGDALNYDWIVEDLCGADGLSDVPAETSTTEGGV